MGPCARLRLAYMSGKRVARPWGDGAAAAPSDADVPPVRARGFRFRPGGYTACPRPRAPVALLRARLGPAFPYVEAGLYASRGVTGHARTGARIVRPWLVWVRFADPSFAAFGTVRAAQGNDVVRIHPSALCLSPPRVNGGTGRPSASVQHRPAACVTQCPLTPPREAPGSGASRRISRSSASPLPRSQGRSDLTRVLPPPHGTTAA
jgi:hypothetical protein